MGESTIKLIQDGGIVGFALFVLVFGAIALHRRWVVIGWVYTDLSEDHETLKQSERESNNVKRELISSLSDLTREVSDMRSRIQALADQNENLSREIRELRQEVRR